MKGYNRLEQIMDYLKSHNLVTVDELVAVTNASPATIRRDLIKLDEQGVISRNTRRCDPQPVYSYPTDYP
ncbi:DeoR family transcriptional regulator [Escherichia coli]|uniref:DeoR family transcriptional regulator n=1 Tax=Escherichia coli TaxID=562 RepID=A0A484VSZ7_ECOLX|nr:DeoR family transcriptional regulator [Escherichia coli]